MQMQIPDKTVKGGRRSERIEARQRAFEAFKKMTVAAGRVFAHIEANPDCVPPVHAALVKR